MNSLKRRGFLKRLTSLSAAAFLGCRLKESVPVSFRGGVSTVLFCSDGNIRKSSGEIDEKRADETIKNAIEVKNYAYGKDEGISSIIKPGNKVSIKLNCLAGRGLSTEPALVNAVISLLLDCGITENNIIVWDRLNDDLERAGYAINTEKGVRCFGNDVAGFTEDFYFFGEVGSLLSRIVTDFSDVIINMPVLKDHGIVGLSAGMKNMFGAIHNPNKYHLLTGNPFVADVYAIPEIKNKTKLTICDATRIQYEAGPPYHPQFCEDYNAIIISEDPVALDFESWKIIEQKRKEHSIKSLKDAGREPSYIFTAADREHNLGYADESKINLIKM